MEKVCAKCGLRFQCGADTPECWCKSVAAYQSVRTWAAGYGLPVFCRFRKLE